MSRLKPWRAEDDSIIFQVEKGRRETKMPFSVFAKFCFLENVKFAKKKSFSKNRPKIYIFRENHITLSVYQKVFAT
jgi:hypothetical protein